MRTSEFDGDNEHTKDYCKVQFSERVVTYVWDISQRRMDLEDRECFSIGLVSEFKVLLYTPRFLNPANTVMISTLIYFKEPHNINAWLRPRNMNS